MYVKVTPDIQAGMVKEVEWRSFLFGRLKAKLVV